MGRMIYTLSDTRSVNTPMKLAKATATAAIVPVCTTKNSDQPKRKPVAGPKASRRKTYCPPARGIIAASSAQHSAPVIVSTPASAHAAKSHPGAPTSAADFAETMKMPEPIIDPITIIVASSRLRPRTRCSGSLDVSPLESMNKYRFVDFVEELAARLQNARTICQWV